MDPITLLGVVVGSSVLSTFVGWLLGGRKRNKVDVLAKQLEAVERRNDELERRCDGFEKEIQQFRQQLYPHHKWDLLAYRKLIEIDPDFPVPPDLYI